MGAIVFLGFMFVIAVLIAMPFVLRDESLRKEMEEQIEALPSFTSALRFDQPDKKLALLLDPESGQFVLAKPKEAPRLYGFDQLIAVDVERDGMSLHKTNRGSQMMGAAVGGALLGPVGLLLGGLTGTKREEERVKRLSLKLVTSDLHTPVTEVIFFDSISGEKPDSTPVKKAAQQLEEWHGRFRTILLGNERAASATPRGQEAPVSQEQPGMFGRRRGLLAES
jgi:hypothetical protein